LRSIKKSEEISPFGELYPDRFKEKKTEKRCEFEFVIKGVAL